MVFQNGLPSTEYPVALDYQVKFVCSLLGRRVNNPWPSRMFLNQLYQFPHPTWASVVKVSMDNVVFQICSIWVGYNSEHVIAQA